MTQRPTPRITHVLVCDLTSATEGNACGLGSVDFAPRRLVDKVDLATTVTNALASCAPEDGKIPLTFANDREALAAALATLRPFTVEDLRLVHIRNALAMDRIEVSQGCVPLLRESADVVVSPNPMPLSFGGDGALLSRLS